MKTYDLDGMTLELVVGDITKQEDCRAVVNAANAELMMGGGVAGAIHRVAGPGLYAECAPLAPISPGQAVITGAHHLPNEYVIHCLGPVYGVDRPSDRLLASCYRNALKLAEENGIESIAFCALSTGAFGYPMEEAATIAISTVLKIAATQKNPKTIRFVLYDQHALDIHDKAIRTYVPSA